MSDTVVKQLSPDLELTPLVAGAAGKSRPLMEWLTTFHLASVVLDPYTNESSWILRTATRVLEQFRGSHARINFVVTAPAGDAKQFLGPLTDRFLTFCDPQRNFVQAVGLQTLPAFVFVRVDGAAVATAEGWQPEQWRAVAEAISATTSWSPGTIPAPGDPTPFAGSPARG